MTYLTKARNSKLSEFCFLFNKQQQKYSGEDSNNSHLWHRAVATQVGERNKYSQGGKVFHPDLLLQPGKGCAVEGDLFCTEQQTPTLQGLIPAKVCFLFLQSRKWGKHPASSLILWLLVVCHSMKRNSGNTPALTQPYQPQGVVGPKSSCDPKDPWESGMEYLI